MQRCSDVHVQPLKRGMKGGSPRYGEKHLHRYLAEFDFRYSNRTKLGVNDASRAAKIVEGAKGERLQYRRPNEILSPNKHKNESMEREPRLGGCSGCVGIEKFKAFKTSLSELSS
jgi:hypothetical protein